ncbi:MAG: hypothetical protein ACLFSL_05075 [Candidatus Woesearchaeota archaeon]
MFVIFGYVGLGQGVSQSFDRSTGIKISIPPTRFTENLPVIPVPERPEDNNDSVERLAILPRRITMEKNKEVLHRISSVL